MNQSQLQVLLYMEVYRIKSNKKVKKTQTTNDKNNILLYKITYIQTNKQNK